MLRDKKHFDIVMAIAALVTPPLPPIAQDDQQVDVQVLEPDGWHTRHAQRSKADSEHARLVQQFEVDHPVQVPPFLHQQFVTVKEIAAELGMNPKLVGDVLDEMMTISNVTRSRRHGFRVADILKASERSAQALLDDFNRFTP